MPTSKNQNGVWGGGWTTLVSTIISTKKKINYKKKQNICGLMVSVHGYLVLLICAKTWHHRRILWTGRSHGSWEAKKQTVTQCPLPMSWGLESKPFSTEDCNTLIGWKWSSETSPAWLGFTQVFVESARGSCHPTFLEVMYHLSLMGLVSEEV